MLLQRHEPIWDLVAATEVAIVLYLRRPCPPRTNGLCGRIYKEADSYVYFGSLTRDSWPSEATKKLIVTLRLLTHCGKVCEDDHGSGGGSMLDFHDLQMINSHEAVQPC